MPPSLTWLIGRQEWPSVEQRLNSVLLDEAHPMQADLDICQEENKTILIFAIASKAPTQIIQLLVECNPSKLNNKAVIRIAMATKASKETLEILQSKPPTTKQNDARPDSPSSVRAVLQAPSL